MSRTYHVFINDAAGSVGEPDEQVRDITEAFREVGVDATVEIVEPERLPEVMRGAWKQGVDAIVVAGGDGTISCAAEVAVADEMVLGMLPMGTFNHFAKDLGMTADLVDAVRFLADAEVVAVDAAGARFGPRRWRSFAPCAACPCITCSWSSTGHRRSGSTPRSCSWAMVCSTSAASGWGNELR